MNKTLKILFFTILLVIALPVIAVKAVDYNVGDYATLKEIVSNNETNKTIVLTGDIVVTDDPGLTIKSGQEVILDLNGHTISMESNITTTSYLIKNNGNLTIKDSTDTNKNGTGNGKIIYTATNPDPDKSPKYASNLITNSGILTIESGLIENDTKGGLAAYVVDNNNSGRDAILTINGGKIYSLDDWGIRMFANSNTYTNDVTINGGTIEGGMWLQAVNSQPKANVTINNGTISGNNYAFYIYDPTTNASNVNVKINGGRFNANTEDGYALYIFDTNENIEINDGYFEGYYALYYFTYNKSEQVTNVVNNGTFKRIL